MNTPPVVSPEEWKTAREELLVKEKEHTRASKGRVDHGGRPVWLPGVLPAGLLCTPLLEAP